MTPERAGAYKRVVKTLRDVGPSKLLRDEEQRIREAADHLLFARDLLSDVSAREALLGVEQLCRALVESGRWEQPRAMRLADDVSSCGPAILPEMLVA